MGKSKSLGIITGVLGLILPAVLCYSSQKFASDTLTLTIMLFMGLLYVVNNVTSRLEIFNTVTSDTDSFSGIFDPRLFISPESVTYENTSNYAQDSAQQMEQAFFGDSGVSISGLLLLASYVLIIIGLILVIKSYSQQTPGFCFLIGGILQLSAIIFFAINGIPSMNVTILGNVITSFIPIPIACIPLIILGYKLSKS